MTRITLIHRAAPIARTALMLGLAASLAGCAGLASGAGADAERSAARFESELTNSGTAGPGLADELAQRNDLKAAAALYGERAQTAPTATERAAAFEKLGDVLLRADRPRQAAGSYRSALREVPGRRSAQAGLGVALLMGGDADLAVAQLEPARSSLDLGVMAALGAAYSALGQYDQALSVFDEGLARSPQDRVLLTNRAVAAALAGDADRAYVDARSVADDPFATPTQQRNLPLVLAIGGDASGARNEGAALRLPSAEVEEVIGIGTRISQATGDQRNQLVLALAGR